MNGKEEGAMIVVEAKIHAANEAVAEACLRLSAASEHLHTGDANEARRQLLRAQHALATARTLAAAAASRAGAPTSDNGTAWG
jgi:hypothetical protein